VSSRLSAHGLAIDLPAGWEGRIYRRPGGDPILHAASFPLPAADGDFGSEATARMPLGGSFLVLSEYRAGQGLEPGRGLFAARQMPLPLELAQFHPRTLQVGRLGQVGLQHFFSAGRRPFCLYAVMRPAAGGRRATAAGTGQLRDMNGVLSTVTFG
jgi:hypothetical protein